MICTSCQIEVGENLKQHYQTELHSINVKRKINNIPPIYSLTEINNRLDSGVNNFDGCKEEASIANDECFLCDVNGLDSCDEYFNHLFSHSIEITDLENTRKTLLNGQCIFCFVQFKNNSKLKKHISKIHIEDTSLSKTHFKLAKVNLNADHGICTLSDGKIIKSKDYNKETKSNYNIAKIDEKTDKSTGIMVYKMTKAEKNTAEKIQKRVRKNELKVSLSMNHQEHFTPHWRQ
ncbi:hypothetical protein EDEG_02900 [Edhazardia aedis USNM 41457]|uniref:C2H2-type domain-containing protein n=1 Tax=Edhazardia aedis (strain USNM 41457) TaxID=1003232 RepID=J9D4I5_EDHAE|nr:hypothetical protein EDEG_02900 [Edhazardia aedis USNM 41457]|eukprot:EJW02716.1 hypothetical protein EDEG_02900 [Edhazardia aedis USNM 41457]